MLSTLKCNCCISLRETTEETLTKLCICSKLSNFFILKMKQEREDITDLCVSKLQSTYDEPVEMSNNLHQCPLQANPSALEHKGASF